MYAPHDDRTDTPPPTAKTIPSNGSTKNGTGLFARAVAKRVMQGAGETSHRLKGWAAL